MGRKDQNQIGGKKAIETDPQMGTNTGVVRQGFKITVIELFRK